MSERRSPGAAIIIGRVALLRLRLLYGGKASFVAACRKHTRRAA